MTMMLNRPEVAVEVAPEPEKAVVSMPTPKEFLALDFVGRRNAVMDFIQANPEMHDQGTWGHADALAVKANGYQVDVSCGTVGCLAGWTAWFAGGRPRANPSTVEAVLTYAAECSPRVLQWETVVLPDGGRRMVWSYAQELLGLTDNDKSHLFAGSVSQAGLRKMMALVNAGKPSCSHLGCECDVEDGED